MQEWRFKKILCIYFK